MRRVKIGRTPSLEQELQTELDLSRRGTSAVDPAHDWIRHAVCIPGVGVGGSQIDLVEKVESLHAELELILLRKVDVLEEREVECRQTRGDQTGPAEVAEKSRSGQRKLAGIEIIVRRAQFISGYLVISTASDNAFVRVGVAVRDQIRPEPSDIAHPSFLYGANIIDCNWMTGGQGQDTVGLPSLQEGISDGAEIP